MLRFFRKFRKQLINSKSFSKYLVYAVGEILLVMVGILLALQVNNWNEDRKAKAIEIAMYKEIKSDIVESVGDIESGLSVQYSGLRRSLLIQKCIKNKLPESDSFGLLLILSDDDDQFFPKTSGFEALKSVGLTSLKNDTLRESITGLFQLGFDRIIQLGREQRKTSALVNLSELVKNYIQRNNNIQFYRTTSRIDSIPYYELEVNNYDAFLKDRSLETTLMDAIHYRINKIGSYERTLAAVSNVISDIDAELKRLE